MGLRCEHDQDAKRAEAALRAALNVEVRDALPEKAATDSAGADAGAGALSAAQGSACQ